MPNAMARLHDNIAVLTFNWHSYSEDGPLTSRWNATEVYSRIDNQWKPVRADWSQAKRVEAGESL